jgi:ssDNA thymidine ADP-ribosyltransferase, DarT
MDPRVTEFHCIMPIGNIPSVRALGILSHERASGLKHHSVAMQPIQDRRDQKSVPGGLKVHQYANVYFHARHPMMSKRRGEAPNLCVLRVNTEILGIAGTVLTDQNASSNYVRFLHPSQWRELDFDDIYATDWRHPGDDIAYWRHKARKCAEVLVPAAVPPAHLVGAYVVDDATRARLVAGGFTLPIAIDPVLFFH